MYNQAFFPSEVCSVASTKELNERETPSYNQSIPSHADSTVSLTTITPVETPPIALLFIPNTQDLAAFVAVVLLWVLDSEWNTIIGSYPYGHYIRQSAADENLLVCGCGDERHSPYYSFLGTGVFGVDAEAI